MRREGNKEKTGEGETVKEERGKKRGRYREDRRGRDSERRE